MPVDFSTTPPPNSNVASKILGTVEQQQQGINAAQVSLLKFKRQEVLDVNEYTVNLLSKVNSEEDLNLAKQMLETRYPEYGVKMKQLLPTYDPQKVGFFKESLKDSTIKIREQELSLGGKKLDLEKEKFGLEEKKFTAGGNKMQGFAPGTAIFQGGKMVHRVPSKAPEPDYDIFEGPEGNQVYIEKGSDIPEGYSKIKGGAGVTIQTGVGSVGKTTRTQLEKDIIEGVRNVQSFKITRKKFKPQYLEWRGKAQKEVTVLLNVLGLSTAGQKKFIKERADWFRRAKADFIAYRKWATGVAGGEKELKEIATSFPDPVKNSPAEYEANLDSIEEATKEVLMLNRDFLDSGIDLSQPLNDIIAEMRGKGIKTPAPPGEKTSSKSGETVIRFDKDGNLIEE